MPAGQKIFGRVGGPIRAAAGRDNEQLVEAVYEELHETRPAGFRYATFRLDDGLSFTHISFAEGDDNPLAASKAFAEFTGNIADRCEIPPQVTEMQVVGSYQPARSRPAVRRSSAG